MDKVLQLIDRAFAFALLVRRIGGAVVKLTTFPAFSVALAVALSKAKSFSPTFVAFGSLCVGIGIAFAFAFSSIKGALTKCLQLVAGGFATGEDIVQFSFVEPCHWLA